MLAAAITDAFTRPNSLRAGAATHPLCLDVIESATGAGQDQYAESVRAVLESIEDALFVVSFDFDGILRLEEFNHAFAAVFGMEHGIDSGEARYKALPIDFATRDTRALRRCSENGRSARFEMDVRTRGDLHRWEFLLNPVLEFGATQRRVLGHGRDVTDHRQTLYDLKRITKKLLTAQDEERRRIARELHDSTAQHLVALGIGIARFEILTNQKQSSNGVGPATKRLIAEMRTMLAEAHNEIRTLSLLLHPPTLDGTNIADTLRRFVAGFARRTGIRASLVVDEGLLCRSPELATTVMRITQEALINVYRHADATKVRVELSVAGGTLVLEIEDNGKGFASNTIAKAIDEIEMMGVGIPGMRARVHQFSGELSVKNGARGVLVRAEFPQ